jgi:hypothetical protein
MTFFNTQHRIRIHLIFKLIACVWWWVLHVLNSLLFALDCIQSQSQLNEHQEHIINVGMKTSQG